MIGFFRSVAEALIEKGVRGLIEDFVPGGKFVCDVAERVAEKEKNRRQRAELRAEFENAILKLDYERALPAAREVFTAVAAAEGAAVSPGEIEAAAQWMAGIPEAARACNRRPEDWTGRTLSLDFSLETPDDVLKVLPPRPPRFQSGQAVPDRADWTLDRILGVGGFGEVWLARHDYFDPRAVKFFFDQTGRDVVREAELVKRAMAPGRADDHQADDPRRHIVPILDVWLRGETPWLMFEYVGGGNLSTWLLQLAGKPAAERVGQVTAALKQLCRGAGVFHSLPKPLAHRDLKPSNILVDTATKRLRITDFGIGAVTQKVANVRESRGESSKGERLLSYLRGAHTPTYSSPQQRRGDAPDPRDDVHALGTNCWSASWTRDRGRGRPSNSGSSASRPT
ncbi:MAG TPA: protein kinase [Urbifossiella sp.]|jgi:hypothetical protein|nr:protein kinase [Urbifossiella sp.]